MAPRKKIAHVESPEELDLDNISGLDGDDEDLGTRRPGGLDVYNEDGELVEEGEPTYIEDPEDE
jgi:hypothetical protein